MKHVPNALTVIRMLLTPVLLVLLLSGSFVGQLAALVIFIFAAVSDYLDGKLARRYKAGSRLGQFLDPFADKVLVLGTFAGLAYLMPSQVPWWGVVLIGLRDVSVTGLRTWAEARGMSLRTLPLAKTKTTIQLTFLIAVLALLVAEKMRFSPLLADGARWVLGTPIVFIGMMVVVIFTVVTGIVYFVRQEYTTPAGLDA